MKTMMCVLILLVSSFCCSAYALEVQGKQVNMENAIDHLKKAKAIMGLYQPGNKPDVDALEQINRSIDSLEKATPNKGGHREAAVKLLNQALKADSNSTVGKLADQAIEEVKKGIKFADDEAAKNAAKPYVQTNMIAGADHREKARAILSKGKPGGKIDKEAISQLNNAKASLEKSDPNKGGHREKAVDLITQAIKASTLDAAVKLTDLAIEEVKMGIDYAEKHKK